MDKENKTKSKVIDLFNAAEKTSKKISSKKSPLNQMAIGSANIQAGRDVNIHNYDTKPKKVTVKSTPVPGTIGAHPDYRRRINDLIDRITEARIKRFPGTTFIKAKGIVCKSVRTEFSIDGTGVAKLWAEREVTCRPCEDARLMALE
jgi:hypothetical protein